MTQATTKGGAANERGSPILHDVAWRWHGAVDLQAMLDRNAADAARAAAGHAPMVRMFTPRAAVLTLGRRVHDVARAGLTETVAGCVARGITVLPVDRGGQATLHLPGQVIVFVAVPCGRLEIAGLVATLLAGAEAVARRYGLQPDVGAAERTGLWSQGRKLVSVGLRHQAGVARHGLALNVTIDTALSRHFILCGQADSGYADLSGAGRSPLPVDVAHLLASVWNLASP